MFCHIPCTNLLVNFPHCNPKHSQNNFQQLAKNSIHAMTRHVRDRYFTTILVAHTKLSFRMIFFSRRHFLVGTNTLQLLRQTATTEGVTLTERSVTVMGISIQLSSQCRRGEPRNNNFASTSLQAEWILTVIEETAPHTWLTTTLAS
ncbi:hypothetical protein MTO96_021150 [Rhipicephalus appendiculatus]